jgi:RNA polymerase sigma-70 factor (ECF subfamily)
MNRLMPSLYPLLPADAPLPRSSEPPRFEVLSRLFAEHNRSLHAFLMSRLGNEQEAREVAQEAYVRLLQLQRPAAVEFLRAYLFKTALNIAVDRARQRGARARLDNREPAPDLVDGLSPERRLMAAEELAFIEKTLHELPPKYRRAFVLHRFDDWSTEQIAAELGVNKRMVRSYLSRTAVYCQLRLKGLSPLAARMQVMP